MNYPDCKKDISSDDTNCPVCGVFVPKSGKDEIRTNIELWPRVKKAVVLSAFLPGAGQIYCGQVQKGAVMLAVFLTIPVALVLSIVASLFFKPGIIIFLAVYLLMLPVWLLMSAVAMHDAQIITKKLEQGGNVNAWEFF